MRGKRMINFMAWLLFVGVFCLNIGGYAAAAVTSTEWKTDNTGTSADDQITLPLYDGGSYNFTVDWGDGGPTSAITAWNDADKTHTFVGGAGTYTVTMTGNAGDITGFRFDNGGENLAR